MANRFDAVFAEASRATGAKFDFLLATAKRESGLRTDAKAPTSSATGLFQFIESTWLETMKEAGPSLGYGDVASKIRKVGDNYIVPDRAQRQEILNLRKDPKVSALMAGAYARKNEEQLSQALGRQPKSGELYAAHFLGAQGSSKLIGLAERQPDVAAHRAFPDQAKANRGVFYHRNGQAKSVREVYDNLVATVPNGAKSQQDATRLTQADVKPLHYVDNLGDRFRKKNSTLTSFMAQMEQNPVRRSRYGGSLEAGDSLHHRARLSRYTQPDSLTRTAGNAAALPGSMAVSSAPVNLLPDGVASFQPNRDGELQVLPKRKPASPAQAGQRFVDLLAGGESSSPVQRGKAMEQGGDKQGRGQRYGALDLNQFLSGNASGAKPKG